MGLAPGNGLPPTGPPVGWLDGIIAAIIAAFNWLLNLLIAIANFLWSVLVSIVKALVTIFQAGFKFLKHIWENYIKKGISWLASHIQKLRAWLKRIVSPVIKWLQKIKKWYDEHILKQQLRLIAMIQKIRRFLGILRIFHIKWAATLDNALADLQNRIQKEIAFIRGIFNQIINTLALVLDPVLLVKRNVLGGSLLSNLGAIKRIFGYGGNRIFSASEVATIDHDSTLFYKSNVDEYVKTLVTTGPTAEDKARDEEIRQALEAATNTKLPA
jgi:hypothetical protein